MENKVPPPKPKRSPGVYTRPTATPHLYSYEPLSTAPADLCAHTNENIFQFPPVATHPADVQASYAGQASECDLRANIEAEAEAGADGAACEQTFSDSKHCCMFCRPYREDRDTIEPLKSRLNSAIEAMDQLNRTYALLDKFLEEKLAILEGSDASAPMDQAEKSPNPVLAAAKPSPTSNDTEFELEHSLTFLESLFGTEIVPAFKQGAFKRIRERSKSMMEDDIPILHRERTIKSISSRPYLLRRQSTYGDIKSKVSKWTKVKAAFKWERANVLPTASAEAIGLTPVNHEVARYLKVPANTCGASSSADSVISSSSGHFLSEAGGTPGTISSASSMDELDANYRHALRRDSSKSDTRCDSRTSDFDVPPASCELSKSATDELRLEGTKHALPSKSASNKSIRRSKIFSDFEVLPEDHVADIKSTSRRRTKLPPSPLNLYQDSNDMPLYSPLSLKSPASEGTQSLNRSKRINSPGNSSVPSSPSRHSDFFGEFESEDISSGDFSEPTTPNRKTFNQKQDEVFQRYQLLLLKLDMEFKAKQRDYERGNRSAPGTTLRSGKKSEEHSPTQVYNPDLISTELLEENLTPEFKKKLHKWRIKKQNSLMAATYNHAQQQQQQHTENATSPTGKNTQTTESAKPKFDWNLWSTGQVKLEGQGLCALPEQKDLPEKFQKKLEQWNKIKSGGFGGATSDNDSLKRASKQNQAARRGSDDDRWYKHKPLEKEKLAKLKAIVAPDHQSKNIEVQTASGVMKFEGISRKFTRKLYEWEKARGIGPEASTFALLHPGYCPIDVRRINKESLTSGADNSPTLSRSLSLDSITPSVPLPTISQQASSLSLNDVNELKSTEDSADALTDHEFKKDDELEAVMVEVEEHIDDTASPLVTAHTLVEQQTPIYKYEEVQCNDYCNTRRVQSFESHTNLAPLLSAVKRAEELFTQLKQASPDIVENEELRSCQALLLSVRSIYPYYSNNLMKATVLNAVSDVQSELGRLSELSLKAPLDEACCQEIMEERHHAYNEEFRGLYESLDCLKQSIQGGLQRYPKDIVPDINITSEDGQESNAYGQDYTCRGQLATTHEATDELSGSHMENETESTTTTTTTYRAPQNANPNGSNKKKLRLRKMGSRQNSKTESDSSDAETHSVLETPRRLRRQKFRLKQRSLDDDFRLRADEPPNQNRMVPAATSEDVLYTLKVKPGQPIEQRKTVCGAPATALPVETKVAPFVPPPLPERHTLTYNTNVFVKTKRKLFTTIIEPHATEGIAVIEKVLDSPTLTDDSVPAETEVLAEASADVPQTSITPATPIELPAAAPESVSKAERPQLCAHKSISLDDLPQLAGNDELRKAQSSETMTPRSRTQVRPPLAADSFRVINKWLIPAYRHASTKASSSSSNNMTGKVPLFKKNSLTKSHTASSAGKIEHRIAKTNSAACVLSAPLVLPNKQDNTLPRIQRKLEGRTMSPVGNQMHFEFPKPLELAVSQQQQQQQLKLMDELEAPVTPISERAMRIQRAKAEFLQTGSKPQTPTTPNAIYNLMPLSESWEQYPRMQTPPPQAPMSASPTLTSHIGDEDEENEGSVALQECASVSTIYTEAYPSDVGTDQESLSICDNSQSERETKMRAVTRSGKISSKLGFATLASKLRRVKVGKRPKDNANAARAAAAAAAGADGSALSALCRQTLLADVIALPQLTVDRPADSSGSHVHKSQSSPHASTSRISHEALNKSQSEQFVKYLVCKESDV